MKQLIYADNAATTKLDSDAFEAMKPFLLEQYGNASQPYSFSRSAKKALKESRCIIASCINAMPEEIFFTSGGTESDNWAIKGSAFGDADKWGTITSQIEHHAVLNACVAIERLGYPVAYLPVTAGGIVLPETLEKIITDKTRLVSVIFVNNEIGTIQPIKELCEVAHQHNALFHTDAVQAMGHIRLDVRELGIDMLSASAHKFNGPKGIGFLYLRKGTPLLPYQDGGVHEFGMRAGTENVASIVGMATALKKNCENIEANCRHLNSLTERLLDRLNEAKIDYLRNGINQLPGLMSLSFKGKEGEALLHRLDLLGICVSTGAACDSHNTKMSHVLQAIGLPDTYAKGTIRSSFSKLNTMDEVEDIAVEIIKIVTEK